MKAEFEHLELLNNTDQKRFELEYNGHVAFIEYRGGGRKYALVHTEAPAELKGTGAAQALVEKTLTYLDQEKAEVLPYCPYILAYIKKHPEWKRLVPADFEGLND